jgi:hypothetical protein
MGFQREIRSSCSQSACDFAIFRPSSARRKTFTSFNTFGFFFSFPKYSIKSNQPFQREWKMVASWVKAAAAAVVGFALFVPSVAKASGSLLGYYPLDGNFNDASGNGNNGTAGSTAPTFGPGHTGKLGDEGAVFSGTDANQLFTIPINLNSLDQVTFGAWVEASNSIPIRGIISNDQGSFGRTIDIDTRAGTTGYSAFDGNGGGVFGGSPVLDGFQFLAVVYNHTAGTETLYVDDKSFTATGVPPSGDDFITVGRNPHFDNPFGGTIDDVFVYGTALSAQQISNIETNGVQTVPVTTAIPLPKAVWSGMILLAGFAAARVGTKKSAKALWGVGRRWDK